MHFHETILTQVEKKKEKEKNENSRKEIIREKKTKKRNKGKEKILHSYHFAFNLKTISSHSSLASNTVQHCYT